MAKISSFLTTLLQNHEEEKNGVGFDSFSLKLNFFLIFLVRRDERKMAIY